MDIAVGVRWQGQRLIPFLHQRADADHLQLTATVQAVDKGFEVLDGGFPLIAVLTEIVAVAIQVQAAVRHAFVLLVVLAEALLNVVLFEEIDHLRRHGAVAFAFQLAFLGSGDGQHRIGLFQQIVQRGHALQFIRQLLLQVIGALDLQKHDEFRQAHDLIIDLKFISAEGRNSADVFHGVSSFKVSGESLGHMRFACSVSYGGRAWRGTRKASPSQPDPPTGPVFLKAGERRHISTG
ncbi:hypothetical protein HCH_03284 [Hahella chejuensis KCTC 2396]|uniref:Uncharacterized protein n=1 Tax=Hahella chejuensis (strain KCTC 2396) TaxID=349521 RepID=Q2SH34_HAHCH|nr:hypothetical protein HCH_03284 [Hahella chejuensis KCTC 2396]